MVLASHRHDFILMKQNKEYGQHEHCRLDACHDLACINMHIHKYIHTDTNRVFKESPVRLKSGPCVQVTFGVAGAAKLSSAEAQARLTV